MTDPSRHDRTAQGIAVILASVLTMAFADAVVKLVSADLTLWQVFVARSLFAVPIIIALLRLSATGLRPRAPGWALVRSALLVLTRGKCRDEAPLTLALALHGSFLVAGLIGIAVLAAAGLGAGTKESFPFLLGGWAPMGVPEWSLMALLGALSAAYFVGVARAYQIAPPPIIATFDYGYLVSAALWGFAFFAETPDLLTIAGMILITAAGLLVAAPSSGRAVPDEKA